MINFNALKRYIRIAFFEVKQETGRDLFGLWWTPISYIILCWVLSVLFVTGDQTPLEAFQYVYVGFVIWQTINKAVIGAVTFLPARLTYYLQNNLSFFEAFVVNGIKTLFLVILNLPFIFLLLIYEMKFSPIWFALVSYQLIMLLAFAMATSWVVAALCVVYKGLGGIVTLGMRFLFFATPIFWGINEKSSAMKTALYNFNPLTYVISFFREGILMNPVKESDLFFSSLAVATIVAIALFFYMLVGKQIMNVS